MSKLVTFLGTGNYQKITYSWGEYECKTALFPIALIQWLQPETVYVMLTAAAEEKHWVALKSAIADQTTLVPVPIPDGKSETELWAIFDKITENLNPNDRVYFDITHSFRSLPLLAMLSAIYLRSARDIQLEGLLYGAYEARIDDRAPVFDLTPFLELTDWISAVEQFTQTGSAVKLATLLKNTHRSIWKDPVLRKNKETLPQYLQKTGGSLENLSLALLLNRPHLVVEAAQNMNENLDAVKEEISQWVKPFGVLFEKIRATYHDFQEDSLRTELKLIQWYLQHGHVIQALTLSREWLISLLCQELSLDSIESRVEVEQALNQYVYSFKGEKSNLYQTYQALEKVPWVDRLRVTWSRLSNLRNDVAHCGKRKDPLDPRKIQEQLKTSVKELERLSIS